ncbi:hypothetical protein [Caldimonas brevitalea]|uniref:Uncharacterized protein n=1 Tax=Caldimonas brevitalea TaxID=413882 RepID=A0A0G3BH98_9BURK|nr:hypothetical protein [Caldimonas brevitalea]AKJ28774.1 hypothetical protein AAW51_2083 [Caldimonas brevitalea]
MIRPALCAAGLLLAGAAVATEWAEEPAAVLGVRLGARVDQLDLPSCPPPAPGGGASRGLCLQRNGPYADRIMGLQGLPDLGLPYSASIHLHEGAVEAVGIEARQADWARLKAILVERYGPATKETVGPVTTGSGAVISSQTLQWAGSATTIVAIERAGRAGTSYVKFSDAGISAKKAATQANTVRDAAGQL